MASRTRKKHASVISMGVELETYSIALPEYRICRELRFPRRSLVEKGERFTRDVSVGSEYNSRVFTTIREAFFLLKSSLRKYTRYLDPTDSGGRPPLNLRRPARRRSSGGRFAIFPTGGWTDRFAGAHVHLALGKKKLKFSEAKHLATQIHDHIPFLIALSANSPVWREKITPHATNRLLRGSDKYCKVTKRGLLTRQHYRELTFNTGGKRKPPTLEIRICDSSIPEYLAAVLCVCRAVALRWQKRRRALNASTHANYLKARDQAVRFGPRARLVWTNHRMRASSYVDIFFRKYREELEEMDIPEDVIRIFKYLKKGWNQSEVIKMAAEKCLKKNRPSWQRQFARRCSVAIEELLDGNSFEQFAHRLGVKLPDITRTWLGYREAKW